MIGICKIFEVLYVEQVLNTESLVKFESRFQVWEESFRPPDNQESNDKTVIGILCLFVYTN